MRRIVAVLAGSLALIPVAASAQDDFPFGEREYAIDEIAADLSYGFCPLYLSGQFPLTDNPQLAERGFGENVRTSTRPSGVTVDLVQAKRPDGTVDFGGEEGRRCFVMVYDADLGQVLETLHQSMAFMGLEFQLDGTEELPEGNVEYFKAPIDGQMLYVQLGRVSPPGTGKPGVVVQMFSMTE